MHNLSKMHQNIKVWHDVRRTSSSKTAWASNKSSTQSYHHDTGIRGIDSLAEYMQTCVRSFETRQLSGVQILREGPGNRARGHTCPNISSMPTTSMTPSRSLMAKSTACASPVTSACASTVQLASVQWSHSV